MAEQFTLSSKAEFDALNLDSRKYRGNPERFPCIAIRTEQDKSGVYEYFFVYPDAAEGLVEATNTKRAKLREEAVIGLRGHLLSTNGYPITVDLNNTNGIVITLMGYYTPTELSGVDLSIADYLKQYEVDIPYEYFFHSDSD